MKKMRKQMLLIVVSAFLFIAAGCGQKAEENQEIPQNAATSEEYSYKEQRKESYDFEAESIAGLYRDIYDRAAETRTVGTLEVMRSMVERIGEHGYVVIDEGNQIDMAGSEQVLDFCGSVDKKQEAELTIIVVTGSGGLIKYDLCTADGVVNVVRGDYQYSNGILENMGTVRCTFSQ